MEFMEAPPPLSLLKVPSLAKVDEKSYVQNESKHEIHGLLSAPWKINMELKYGGLEDDVPFQLGDFWVPC